MHETNNQCVYISGHKGKRLVGRSRHSFRDNIKMDHKEIGVNRIHLSPGTAQWWALMSTVHSPVHITRGRAGAHQVCARWEARLAFTCARKSSSTLLQLLARLRLVRIRIFTRSVYRL
jgi:hypothetical protein